MCGLDDDCGAMTERPEDRAESSRSTNSWPDPELKVSWKSSEFLPHLTHHLNMFVFVFLPPCTSKSSDNIRVGCCYSFLCSKSFTKCTLSLENTKRTKRKRHIGQEINSLLWVFSSRLTHKVFLVVSKGPFRHNKTWHRTCWLKWLEPGHHGRKTNTQHSLANQCWGPSEQFYQR